MVYSALQIITRGRDEGVTVVQLGQKSKYDQKTCFYLVRQLTEMDLVVKVRRGGVGTHFCIHKYFYERSSDWQAIREEETQAEEATRRGDIAPEVDDEDDANSAALQFTPIDSRHLSSLPLVKARIVKLLKASQNNIHASNNLLLTLVSGLFWEPFS
jgi:transcription factor C subunit 3